MSHQCMHSCQRRQSDQTACPHSGWVVPLLRAGQTLPRMSSSAPGACFRTDAGTEDAGSKERAEAGSHGCTAIFHPEGLGAK